MNRTASVLLSALVLACGYAGGPDAAPATDAQAPEAGPIEFWASLEALCGQAFEGRITASIPPDASFDGQRLVMHVRECSDGEIRVPFFVGDDRSRTWVVTKTPDGLRLKHDHRHEDGTEDEVTQYGGDSREGGTTSRQDFPADALTAQLVPAAARNVWTIEIEPDRLFAYGLRRGGSDRLFRVEFDLTRPIAEPPPPWGG